MYILSAYNNLKINMAYNNENGMAQHSSGFYSDYQNY